MMSTMNRGNVETTAVDLLVVVEIGERVQHAATHVGDVGLGELHLGTDDSSQAAVPHEDHHYLIIIMTGCRRTQRLPSQLKQS